MKLELTDTDGPVTHVRLDGRLDAPGADAIGVRFTAATVSSGKPAVVDLSGVSFIASMGIRLLLSAARGLDIKGSRLVLAAPQPAVREILEQTAIDQIVPIVDTVDEALAQLEPPQA